MSQTNSFTTANRVAGPVISRLGVIPITIVFSAETYATASGGIAVDLTTELALCGVAHADCLSGFVGNTITGHLCVWTKSATSGQFTVKIWNGTTQLADGSTSVTLNVLVPFSAGAKS